MRRGFWFVAGAGAGVYAVVRGRRAAEAFTADGLADRMQGWQVGARLIRDEFTAASSEREIELRERYGLAPNGRLELTGPQRSGGQRSGPQEIQSAPRKAPPTDGHR